LATLVDKHRTARVAEARPTSINLMEDGVANSDVSFRVWLDSPIRVFPDCGRLLLDIDYLWQ
jgi:hypothetical protein